MSLSETFNDPNLLKAAGNVNQLYSAAATSASQEANLPQMLRDALTAKFSRDNPLIQQQEAARGEFLSAADLARQRYAPSQTSPVIFSPTQQRSLVSQAQATALVPLMSLNDILLGQTGGISNIIDSLTKSLATQTAARKLAAEGAQQSYKNLYDLLAKQADIKLEEKKLKTEGGGFDLLSYLNSLVPATTQTTLPTEPMPEGTPSQEMQMRVSRGGGAIFSPQGQWAFNTLSQEWEEVVD